MKRFALLGTVALCAAPIFAAHAATEVKEEYQDFEAMEYVPFAAGDGIGAPREASMFSAGSAVFASFQGISQYDVATYARNFIPPDTMGAVGLTQYTSFVNGGFAVFDKGTGATLAATSDIAFWAAAGRTGANGDSRVMFDSATQRWVALSFASSVSNIQIAVSDTADALGPWRSTVFTGFAGGTADYPTMALDANALYIGTNNFNSAGSFRGTTLNVIPIDSIFDVAGPTTAGRAVINTPYSPTTGGNDGGFAIQGVNSSDNLGQGHVLSASLFYNDTLAYDVNFSGGTASSVTGFTYLGTQDYGPNGAGRQPNAVPDTGPNADFSSNDRVIDTLDQRISAAVYQSGDKIYSVYTATDIGSDLHIGPLCRDRREHQGDPLRRQVSADGVHLISTRDRSRLTTPAKS